MLSIHSYVLLYIMYCGIPTWKPVLPVDIIDISAMVTRQGACTPPHWVTTWSRDACSQGQSSCWHQCVWKPHSQVLPCSFLSLAVQFVRCTHGESLGMSYMYSTSAKLVNSHLYVTSITSFVDSLSRPHPPPLNFWLLILKQHYAGEPRH